MKSKIYHAVGQVYCLFNYGRVVYVGISKDPVKRIAQHKFYGKKFQSFSRVFVYSKQEGDTLERTLIQILKPDYNIRHKL